ncbi:XRE family transcriptional regulator [Pseudonocardia kunmingensis]|uniref:XRE family transcriptional regulator n=1 Tax=Pseudonocardia kunmingensis TaxID=630975 RepID=UPI001150B8D9|nr:XRE family transcriptional regulator [Pseudonocardia kunmingensis]
MGGAVEPNTRLRALRESRPSTSIPGAAMSRAELAEAVNAELWQSTGRRYALDAHTIARYERGAVRWPNAAYRSALRKVLGATDGGLGFRPTPRGPATGHDELGELEVHLPAPARAGWPEVEQVRNATTVLARSENLFGGGVTCHAAVSQLRATAELLSVPTSNAVRSAMAEAVGNMAGVVAFTAFDVGDHKAAKKCFQFALRCANDAGSWPLRSNVLAEMARTAAHGRRFDDALSLVELAQVRSDRLTATAQAMTGMLRARALAHLGRQAEAADEITRADDWMTRSDPAVDPPWLCYYDKAEHQGSTGCVLAVLAEALRDPLPAAARLAEAVKSAGDAYPRSRTFSRTRLATLLMKLGDPVEASTIGRVAVREAAQFRSERIRHELSALAAASRTRPTGSTVELRQMIEALPRRS